MTSSRSALLVAALSLACGGGGGSSDASTFRVVPGDNVLAVSVNGSACAAQASVNTPCVRVKVCAPGSTTNCQVIDGVLLDTGSVGLHVFRDVLPQALLDALQPVKAGGNPVAECVQYADMTADWGPVEIADVVLANEPPVRVPIQVIDATFGSPPTSCGGGQPEKAPAGLNGILGVGVFLADCGDLCASEPNNGFYFTWNGSAATRTTVPATSQLQNPVALLPVDNNGLILALPGVPDAGAPSVDGSVVLGIGTRSNNAPAKATPLPLDRYGEFTTTISGGAPARGSFVDTGSNGLFFAPPSSIPTCSDQTDWFCPPSAVSFSATNAPSAGGATAAASFRIGNFDALLASPTNAVFSQIGGPALSNAGFDWGLPFFLGRTVYVGFEAPRSSPLGPGPLIAY